MKMKVGVIFGGKSVEHEVSIISALQTFHAIDRNEFDVIPIYISKNGQWFAGEKLTEIENFKRMDDLLAGCEKVLISANGDEHALFAYPKAFSLFAKPLLEKIDVAFPVMHGTHGEDGAMQGLFELMNLPYVGCDVLASAIGMDKITQKMIFQAVGLPIVEYTWFYSRDWVKGGGEFIEQAEQMLTYPMIVKPAALGSSIGVAKAENREELEAAIDTVRGLCARVLIEQAVAPLQEINCSVLGDYEHVEASVCEEPVGSLNVLSFDDKYVSGDASKGMSGAKRKIPAEIPDEMTEAIQKMAKSAFLTLNCHGVVRIDFMVNRDTERVYINEINTIPGSLSFYLWEASGKSFTQLTTDLINLALKRQREKNSLTFSYQSNILAGFSGAKGVKK